ncbi:helix-turn-helix domain-containing protein [Rothia nasimurium]|uniref:helix-turn-helix domain-containing protein n=1 Tax=Rothia nasimurium TaxID=85336 RepID=UPI001F338843|nr:helix-turn-helix transcriptional regulator [Rothia nasimurium]
MKDLSEIISENIKLALAKRGESQHSLALAVGISKSKMSTVLRGESTLDSLEIYSIATHFQISISWFYEEHLGEIAQAA